MPSETQVGVVVGIGVRWRLDNVLGIRTEASGNRWFAGATSEDEWGGQLKVGISAFTGGGD
jgi:hypothetical protein